MTGCTGIRNPVDSGRGKLSSESVLDHIETVEDGVDWALMESTLRVLIDGETAARLVCWEPGTLHPGLGIPMAWRDSGLSPLCPMKKACPALAAGEPRTPSMAVEGAEAPSRIAGVPNGCCRLLSLFAPPWPVLVRSNGSGSSSRKLEVGE